MSAFKSDFLRILSERGFIHQISDETGLDELFMKEIRALLARFGVEEVPAAGARFDPNVHEAVAREATGDHEEGEIVEKLRRGYRMQDRLLRPSQVKVAVAPVEASTAGNRPRGRES